MWHNLSEIGQLPTSETIPILTENTDLTYEIWHIMICHMMIWDEPTWQDRVWLLPLTSPPPSSPHPAAAWIGEVPHPTTSNRLSSHFLTPLCLSSPVLTCPHFSSTTFYLSLFPCNPSSPRICATCAGQLAPHLSSPLLTSAHPCWCFQCSCHLSLSPKCPTQPVFKSFLFCFFSSLILSAFTFLQSFVLCFQLWIITIVSWP